MTEIMISMMERVDENLSKEVGSVSVVSDSDFSLGLIWSCAHGPVVEDLDFVLFVDDLFG